MLWLALNFRDLPLELLSAGCATGGTTKGAKRESRPLIVLQDNRVLQRNAAAKASGIALGVTLATAHSIDVNVLHAHRDSAAEQRRLKQLADALYRFSGHVSLQLPACILLEIGGSLKLFGDCSRQAERTLTAQALALCASLGHCPTARVAATPRAAVCLAQAAADSLEEVPLDKAGLEAAGVHPNVVERFANMGIYTLGAVLDLPRKALGRRFGKPLLTFIEQLTGATSDPREALVPAPQFDRQIHLLQPINDKQDLQHEADSPMQRLARELQHWLIAKQLGCERLHWYFVSHRQETAYVPVRFAKQKQNMQELLRISGLALEKIDLPHEVLSVGLAAKRLQRWRNDSHSLFRLPAWSRNVQTASLAASNQDLADIVDEFNARLGPGVCQGIGTVSQHTPEAAWAPQHLLRQHTGHIHTRDIEQFLRQVARRPIWLFAAPYPVERKDLVLIEGPERIQSQWWQQEATCRDYYVARHRQGSECWVFREPTEAQPATSTWYLHGYFG